MERGGLVKVVSPVLVILVGSQIRQFLSSFAAASLGIADKVRATDLEQGTVRKNIVRSAIFKASSPTGVFGRFNELAQICAGCTVTIGKAPGRTRRSAIAFIGRIQRLLNNPGRFLRNGIDGTGSTAGQDQRCSKKGDVSFYCYSSRKLFTHFCLLSTTSAPCPAEE